MLGGRAAARRMMQECGLEDPTEIPLELIIAGRGVILIEKPLHRAEGRIVFGKSRSIVTVNSDIQYSGKRRFVIAHELGHHEMHRHLIPVHYDTDASLEYFKTGHQEAEANEFACELLMPEELFSQECSRKSFSPDLLRSLAERFQTSITSAVYRYFELGQHPICLIYCHNNVVKYWKRPENYPYFLIDRTRLSPPEGSVAAEFFQKGIIYPKEHSKQRIWKSDWFELKTWENDQDTRFYEYCIVTKHYNTTLSVVWEE